MTTMLVSRTCNTHATTFTYNNKRQLLPTRDALNFGTTQFYDLTGRLTATTDRFGRTTTASYTSFGRPINATAANGATTSFRHDTRGRLDRITNPLNQITGFGFDDANRPTTTTDALTQIATHGYDAADNRTTFQNTRGKTWTWVLNPINQIDTLTTPLGRIFDTDYNTRELPSTLKEPSLQTTTLTYWDDQRPQQLTDPTGTITFGYDTKARLHTVTQGAATLTRNYDQLDRLTSFTDTAGNTIQYAYDGAGNLTQLTYPGGIKTVTYTYDTADRLDYLTDWAGRITDFQYDNNSRLSQITFPNGTRRIYTYDTAGRILSQRDETSTAQTITKYNFNYDLLSRIIQETVTPEPTPYAVSPATMTYDDDDRLLTWNGQTCLSDLDGNLTNGPVAANLTTLVYDTRNRLTSAGGLTYTYDAENRRLSQTDGTTLTTYIHDPQSTLTRLLVRTKASTLTRYVYAPGILLYEETGTTTKTYHTDYRGSTAALTDDTQTITDRITYGSFGEIVATTGTTDTPFLYNGAYGVETDNNGLILMRARYYNPDTRRFLNADPIGFGGGANWYAYVANNPMNQVDPLGLDDMSFIYGNTNIDNSQAYKDDYTVAGHGDRPGGVFKDSKGKSISAAELAKMIKADPKYNPSTRVRLMSCYSTMAYNEKGDSFARDLAVELNKLNGVDISQGTAVWGVDHVLKRDWARPWTLTQAGKQETDNALWESRRY